MLEPSYKIAQFFGIPIRIHWTFVLVVPLGILWWDNSSLDVQAILYFALLFVLTCICVILHEYGHALAAQKYGIQTDDIILSPFFGVARLQKIPNHPLGEFLVALAGPAVNAILGLLIFLLLFILHPDFVNIIGTALYDTFWLGHNKISTLPQVFSSLELTLLAVLLVNICLVVFNIIPAFPMDGGRMLRAFFHHFTRNKLLATRWATWIGIGISSICVLFAILYAQYAMALVGIFVFYMAISEMKMVKREFFFQRFQVKEMMKTQFHRLDVSTTPQELLAIFHTGFEQNFLIQKEEKLLGIITKNQMIDMMKNSSFSQVDNIEPFVKTEFPYLSLEQKTNEVLDSMRSWNILFLPVKEGNEIVGVLSHQDIYNYLSIQQELQS